MEKLWRHQLRLSSLLLNKEPNYMKTSSPVSQRIYFSNDSNSKEPEEKSAQLENNKKLEKLLFEPPTTCCMSGCNNCVWIAYAEELGRLSKDGGVEARLAIDKNVTDPFLKAFLLMELKLRAN